MSVCLDAGHGGSDPGAVNANLGIAEKKLTLQIAGYVRDALNSRGVRFQFISMLRQILMRAALRHGTLPALRPALTLRALCRTR